MNSRRISLVYCSQLIKIRQAQNRCQLASLCALTIISLYTQKAFYSYIKRFGYFSGIDSSTLFFHHSSFFSRMLLFLLLNCSQIAQFLCRTELNVTLKIVRWDKKNKGNVLSMHQISLLCTFHGRLPMTVYRTCRLCGQGQKLRAFVPKFFGMNKSATNVRL